MVGGGALPAAFLCIRCIGVEAESAAVAIDLAVVAVASALVGWPAHLVAEVGEVLVHLLGQTAHGFLGDEGIGLGPYGHAPPFAVDALGHADVLRQRAFGRCGQRWVFGAEVVVEGGGVAGPLVAHALVVLAIDVDGEGHKGYGAAGALVAEGVEAAGADSRGGLCGGDFAMPVEPVPVGLFGGAARQGELCCELHALAFLDCHVLEVGRQRRCPAVVEGIALKRELEDAAGLRATHVEAQAVGLESEPRVARGAGAVGGVEVSGPRPCVSVPYGKVGLGG